MIRKIDKTTTIACYVDDKTYILEKCIGKNDPQRIAYLIDEHEKNQKRFDKREYHAIAEKVLQICKVDPAKIKLLVEEDIT